MQEIPATTDEYLWRDAVRQCVADCVKRLVRSRKTARDKILVIYMNEEEDYACAQTVELGSHVRTYLELNMDYIFTDVTILKGRAPVKDLAIPVTRSIQIAVTPAENKSNTNATEDVTALDFCPACIRIHNGRGSIYGDKVVLQPLHDYSYNIGVGRHEEIGSQVRENHIAIIREPEDEKFEEYNRYVSRAHARIVFRKGKGWKLYAEERGLPTHRKKKTTELSRDTKVISLNDTGNGYRLRHGDHIILNKRVILKFELLRS